MVKVSLTQKNALLDGKLCKTDPTSNDHEEVLQKKTFLVHNLIDSDLCIKISKTASAVGISYGSVQSIINKNLNYQKVSSRWVPHLLTQKQKHVHLMFVKAS